MVTIAVVAALWPFLHFLRIRAAFREEQEERRLSEAEEALRGLSGADAQHLLLVLANRKQMAHYEFLARRQAESSYRYSLCAMGVGLVAVVGGAVTAIVVGDTTAKVTTAVLAAVSGALSGYVSKTFMRTYQWTLSQLNYYFEEPLISSYVLTAERLIAHLASANQDEARNRLIDCVIMGKIRGEAMPADVENGSSPISTMRKKAS